MDHDLQAREPPEHEEGDHILYLRKHMDRRFNALERIIMAQVDDLKQALSDLAAAQTAESDAFTAALGDLVAAVQAGSPDLTSEIAAVRAAAGIASTNAAAAKAADPGAQPAPPAPTP